jgi:hypothetical protein
MVAGEALACGRARSGGLHLEFGVLVAGRREHGEQDDGSVFRACVTDADATIVSWLSAFMVRIDLRARNRGD